MLEVRQTEEFSRWVGRLRDTNAVARIVSRIRRMELGNLGDSKSLRGGLMGDADRLWLRLPRQLRAPWHGDRDPVMCRR